MNLPSPIQTYFDADRTAGGPAPVAAFLPGASVKDEGRTHVGHDAIAAWWSLAKAQYQHRAEPQEIAEARGRTLIRAEVTGAFPGSPAVLTFAFRLEDDRIAALEISA